MASIVGIFKAVAPWLFTAASTMLPGPLGAVALAVGKAVGKPDLKADPTAIAEAVAGATPEQLAAIKQADQQFQLDMQKAGFEHIEDLAKMEFDDTANARAREIALKDKIPALLAIGITIGFFGLLLLMMFYPPPQANKDLINIMLGSLGTSWIAVIGYYFGSSKGSDDKNEIISNLSK